MCLKLYSLDQNEITSEGASVLFENLIAFKHISSIRLSHNKIDDKCLSSLGELIKERSSLKSINIQSNKITDEGIENLQSFIVGNMILESIDLSDNVGITEKSGPAFVEIAARTFIKFIGLNSTLVDNGFIAEIKMLLAIPVDQREIPTYSPAKSAAKSS